jgi:hypothetical protein
MPVRKIGMSSRSVTGEFDSVKTKRRHRSESTLEFDFFYHLEFDPLVKTFDEQPLFIDYITDKGKKSKYTPDVKITYTTNGVLEKGIKYALVEVKYAAEVDEFKKESARKIEAAKKFCKSKGGKFEIVDEQIIRTIRLDNYKFLHRYLHPSAAPKLKLDLMNLAKELKIFTANDWVSRIEGSKLIKGQALSNLWHLVALRQLIVNFDKPVNMISEIRSKMN